ncbi:MAG: tripartite tricarboxylate transporter permease [Rhodospirillales bacterium]|nr:tripartite tricarboxylate transporter permease [Rhodospirillales bacterium]
MTELLSNLALGLSVAVTPENLLFCFVGCLLGTLIGVLPGIGPLATFAMLLPITYYLPPAGALIMLAGVYYGAQYGGSTTAILVNIPGEASSVVTCLDGHAMTRQGRAGVALATAAVASLIAGCIATLVIVLAGPPLSRLALLFGPADYVAVMLLGLVAAVLLGSGSILKSAGMVVLGVLFSLVGTDVNTGGERYTFGIPELAAGLEFIPVAMGIFGVAEIVSNLEATKGRGRTVSPISSLIPSREDVRRAFPAALRGTALGSFLGILPGGGATVSSFASYSLERKISKSPRRFGHGAVEGVAGPEAANNAGAQTSFIPMLSLGIPPNALMALMMGAMMIQGITPGPQVMTAQPALFWGLIVSMWIGNLVLVILNLPLIGIWVRLLRIPYGYLFPAIMLLCIVGTYSVNARALDVQLLAIFGVIGYLFFKLDCPPAPLLLGLVLGSPMEEQLRRALLLADGDWSVFVTSPISLGFLVLSAVMLVVVVFPTVRQSRDAAFAEEQ